jgi:hypothetical protein
MTSYGQNFNTNMYTTSYYNNLPPSYSDYQSSFHNQQPLPVIPNSTSVIYPSVVQIESNKQRFERKLKEKYPKIYGLIHSGVLGLVGVAGIILQSILISKKAPDYQVAGGIWAGAYCLIVSAVTISTSKVSKLFSF